MRKRAASTMLPINFLKQLIGLYGNSMQNFVPQYLEAAMDAFQRNQSAVKDAFGGNVFADLAKRNMAMFEDASRAFSGKTESRSQARARRQRRRATESRACRASGQSRPAEPLTIMRFADCRSACAGRRIVARRSDATAISAPQRRSPVPGPMRRRPTAARRSSPMRAAARSCGCTARARRGA